MTKRRYKHPSIVEAVCELRFPSDNKWGILSFIQFAEAAKKKGYTEVVDAAVGYQFNFQVGEKEAPPEVKPVSRRIQTWNKAKNELWQASPEMFAANRREPYMGWEKFRPQFLTGYENYARIAKPKKADRLVLHYINRIPFSAEFGPEHYVEFLPPRTRFGDKFLNFVCQTEQVYKDGDLISVTSSRDMTAETDLALVLNIIYTKVGPRIDRKGLEAAIDKGHDRLIQAFEKSITDEQRKRMEEK